MMYLSGLALVFCALATVAIFAGLLGRQIYIKGLAIFFMMIVFIIISAILTESLMSEEFRYSMRSWYLLPLVWFMLILSFIVYFLLKLDFLFLIISPLSFVILFTAFIFPSKYSNFDMTLTGPIFWVHVALVFIGLGLMALAACAAFFFLMQERILKKKLKLSSLPQGLPSIMALDKTNAVATAIGFPFYLLGILSGFSWAYIAWGTVFTGDPKEIITLIILLLYAFMFIQRVTKQSYGRTPAFLSIFIFCASILSIVIVNIFLPTHHSFTDKDPISQNTRGIFRTHDLFLEKNNLYGNIQIHTSRRMVTGYVLKMQKLQQLHLIG